MNFNSHTREGVTKIVLNKTFNDFDFNSHTREGVTYYMSILDKRKTFQLTHP